MVRRPDPLAPTTVFLTVAQLASRWGCGRDTIYRRIRDGSLNAHPPRLGAKQPVRIALRDVELLEAQRDGAA